MRGTGEGGAMRRTGEGEARRRTEFSLMLPFV